MSSQFEKNSNLFHILSFIQPRDNLILPVQNDDDPPGSVLPSQFTMASHNTLHDQTNGQIAMVSRERNIFGMLEC